LSEKGVVSGPMKNEPPVGERKSKAGVRRKKKKGKKWLFVKA